MQHIPYESIHLLYNLENIWKKCSTVLRDNIESTGLLITISRSSTFWVVKIPGQIFCESYHYTTESFREIVQF